MLVNLDFVSSFLFYIFFKLKLPTNNNIFLFAYPYTDPVTNLGTEASYDYVFGGPLEKSALQSTSKLTSPPIRLRSEGK